MAEIFDNAHALLIGVGKDLPFTVDDAKAFQEVFTDPLKAAYNPDNVNLVAEEQATKQGIIDGFNRLITDTDENSTVVVYYSGHGAVTQSGETFLLVPHNYDPMDFKTWVMAEEFSEKVSQIKAKKMVVLLDACHSQGMSKSVDNINAAVPVSKNVRSLANELSKGSGRAILSSCEDNELSWKLPGDKNSLFTKTILEALQGKHLRDPDEKFVDMLQIIRYVFKEVPERSKTVGENREKKQHPFVNSMTNLSSDGFPICFLPEGIRKSIDAKPLPPPKSRDLIIQEKEGIERNISLLLRKIEFMEKKELILSDADQLFQIQENLLELKDKHASFKRRIDILVGMM